MRSAARERQGWAPTGAILKKKNACCLKFATPPGTEPATNSLEVFRIASNFNGHSGKNCFPAALFNKTRFQFVGMK
jgi:hypothetical protein